MGGLGGTNPAAAGLVTAAMLVLTVASQSLVPGAARRFGTGPVLAVGLVLLGAPTPAYLLHSGLTWLTICSAVRGLGFAVVTVLLPLLATRRRRPRNGPARPSASTGSPSPCPTCSPCPAGWP